VCWLSVLDTQVKPKSRRFNVINKTLLIIVAIILILIGGFVGYKLKQCPGIVNTVYATDTIYQGYPIVDTEIVTKPITKVVIKEVVRQVLVNKTDTITIDYPEWEQTDRITYEGLNIDINDKGNCNGVIERKSKFSGELKERIVTNTVTNNVALPPPFLSLYAGASASFSNRWKAFDVAPAVSMAIRQRHIINYSYGINTSTHNFSIQTKIR